MSINDQNNNDLMDPQTFIWTGFSCMILSHWAAPRDKEVWRMFKLKLEKIDLNALSFYTSKIYSFWPSECMYHVNKAGFSFKLTSCVSLYLVHHWCDPFIILHNCILNRTEAKKWCVKRLTCQFSKLRIYLYPSIWFECPFKEQNKNSHSY